MSKLKIQPSVVLTEIHGIYLLVSDREARKHCPYIRQINDLGALIWEELLKGKSRDETVSRIRQEYEIPECIDLGTDVDHFVNSLKENHYIICEAESHEI